MNYFLNKSQSYIFVSLFLVSLILRIFFLLYYNFDGFYGQDSYAYADYSKQFAEAISKLQIPPNFYWPIGFYVVTALFHFCFFVSINQAALLVSLIAGSLLPGMIYFLCCELLSDSYETFKVKQLSFIAGLITLFCGALVKSSIVVMSDSLAMLLLISSVYWLFKYIKRTARKYLVISMICFSYGMMTRYANGLFLLVIITGLARMYIYSDGKKKIFFDSIIAFLAGAIVFAPQLYYISKFGIAYMNSPNGELPWVARWSITNFFAKDFYGFEGITHYKIWNGLYYLSPVFHPMYLSLFGFSFAYGIFSAMKKKFSAIHWILLLWFFIYYVYLSGNPYQSIRYTLSYFPVIVFIAVYGIGEIKIRTSLKNLYIGTALVLMTFYLMYDTNKFIEKKNQESGIITWAEKNIPRGSLVFSFGITGALNHYTNINAREFYSSDYEQVKQSLDSTKTASYFVFPLEVLQTQWKGLNAGMNYEKLKTNNDLREVSSSGDYTIFKVNQK